MITLVLLTIGFLSGGTATDSLQHDQVINFTIIGKEYDRAAAVYATALNEIFIVETGKNRIVKAGLLGTRLDSLGSRGRSDYRFDRPTGLDATNGMRIFVADRNNKRIQIFDRRMQYLSSLQAPDRPGFSETFFNPELVTVNKFSDIFVYESDQNRLLKYNQQGRFELEINLRGMDIEFPIAALSHYEDTLFLAEGSRGFIHILNSGGSYRSFIGGFDKIGGLFTSDRNIWVATQNEIVKLDFRGSILERYRHNIEEMPVGITAHGRTLYVLTERRLYMAGKP